jgi:hypothetical protein
VRRKPELVNAWLIPWEEDQGLWGIAYDFSDGHQYREHWGGIEETLRVVEERRRDIRRLTPPRPLH